MTQLDPGPPKLRPRRRSWRDLPASPPIGDPHPPITEEQPVVVPTEPAEAAEKTPRSGLRMFTYALTAVVVVLVGAAVWLWQREEPLTTTPTVAAEEAEAGSPGAVAAALGPAVVHIEILGGLEAGGGVGSGVIYDTSGLVLTAHHVVSFSDEVTVMTADERSFSGRV
ncbi:MAG: hypothetical protein ACRDWF_08555, partial [Acidimicrobiia bacterium]